MCEPKPLPRCLSYAINQVEAKTAADNAHSTEKTRAALKDAQAELAKSQRLNPKAIEALAEAAESEPNPIKKRAANEEINARKSDREKLRALAIERNPRAQSAAAKRLVEIGDEAAGIEYAGTDHSEDDKRMLSQNESNIYLPHEVDESLTFRRRMNAARRDIKALGLDEVRPSASNAPLRIAAFNKHGIALTWKGEDKVTPQPPEYVEGEEAIAFNTPNARLAMLAKNPMLTEKVAGNAGASTALLDSLAHHENPFVRAHVAGNKSTSVETLDRLARGDRNHVVQRYLAGNRNTPVEHLRTLSAAFPAGGMSQEELARNPSAPSDALHHVAKTGSWHARKNVAENKSTAPETSAMLLRDSFEGTRTAVRLRKDFHQVASIALATDDDGVFDEGKYRAYLALDESSVKMSADKFS